MDESRRAAVEAIARAMTTEQRPTQPGLLPLPEIPAMHQGRMFNIFEQSQRTDGRAQSLDFYVQPQISQKGIGLDGAGVVYRKTW